MHWTWNFYEEIPTPGFATANNKNNTMYTGNLDVTTRATTTRNIIRSPITATSILTICLTPSSPTSTTQRRSTIMLHWMTLTTIPLTLSPPLIRNLIQTICLMRKLLLLPTARANLLPLEVSVRVY